MTRPTVIFATTVFDDVATGPGVYARYLWGALRDDDELELHVVAPSFAESHPRLHAAGGTGREVYGRVAAKALELTAGREDETILHGNAAHAMLDFCDYPGPWIVQVNDYEVATLWSHALGTLFGFGPRRLTGLMWRRRREARVVRAATRVVCNSEFTRRAVLKAYRPDESKVLTIHKGVDVSGFSRPAELGPDPLGDRPAGGRLAFVGTNWRIKGLDVLLNALARLAGAHPEVTLVVAGEDPSGGGASMRRLCGRLGLEGRVFFVGRLDRAQLAEMLWHADVFVLPSRREAFGVAALEAMAAGVPVVASRAGGLSEIIREPTDGVLCEPGRPKALTDAIARLIGYEQRRRELAWAGPKRAGDFDVPPMVARVRELYLSLIDTPGPES